MIAFLSHTNCVRVCVWMYVDVSMCSAALHLLIALFYQLTFIHYISIYIISHIFWLQKPIGSARHTHTCTLHGIAYVSLHHFMESNRSTLLCMCFVSIQFDSFFVVSIIEANESYNKFNTLDTFRYIRDKGNVKIFLFFWFALCVHSRSQSLISDSIAMAFLVKHLDNLSLLHSSQIVFFSVCLLFSRSFLHLLFVILKAMKRKKSSHVTLDKKVTRVILLNYPIALSLA